MLHSEGVMRDLFELFTMSNVTAAVAGSFSCMFLAVVHFMAAQNANRNRATRFVDRLFTAQPVTLPLDRRTQMRILAFLFAAIALGLVSAGVVEVTK